MSRDLGRDVPDLEKLYARKLWADFSYPMKTTFDMTTLIFGTGRVLLAPCLLKGGPGTLLSWLVTENLSREVATKDHSSSNPPKGNPSDLKTKVDVSLRASQSAQINTFLHNMSRYCSPRHANKGAVRAK